MTTESILGLVALAFALSWDNFRSSVALGTVPFGWRRALQIALVFGFWDTVAPLVGGLIGRYFGGVVGRLAEYVGPVVLGAYGLYPLVGGWPQRAGRVRPLPARGSGRQAGAGRGGPPLGDAVRAAARPERGQPDRRDRA